MSSITQLTEEIYAQFWGQVDKGPDCWLWHGRKDLNGYGKFSAYSLRVSDYMAHRFAWEVERGPIPPGLKVCHRCDVRACVRPDHLFLGTQQENMADRQAKGRQARGSRNARTKLRESEVDEIRQLLSTAGINASDIARRYGVSPSAMTRIKYQMWVEDLQARIAELEREVAELKRKQTTATHLD